MRRNLLYFFILANLWANAQKLEFTSNSLIGLTELSNDRFQDYFSRKGYREQPSEFQSHGTSFYKRNKRENIENLIEKFDASNTSSVVFQTTSFYEFKELNNELQQSGYAYAKEDQIKKNIYSLYQKGNVTIQPQIKEENGKTLYCFIVERKKLPHPTQIVHAEDLLQLTTHEYIAAVYGAANVKKDVFYFSEKEVNKCSVLFPNTTMQVIFIWKDEVKNRDISFLIIGSSYRKGAEDFYRSMAFSKWKSSQGIYPGMSLNDLCELNGNHLNFYGWESEEAGFVQRNNTGVIDFKKTGVQLSCLDCYEDKFYSNSKIINSADVLKKNSRVYVSTLIIVPE